ncbi:MAG: zf-HC2 domain-containing protein [Myxococcota bacterium]
MPATKDTSAELITAYLDAELPEEDAAAFEAQLAEDPEAMSEVEQLRKVMSLVSSLPEVQAPPDFYEKVSRRIRRRQLFASEGVWTLVSLPFQVLSIIIILTVAALNMMAQLEQQPQKLERESIIGTDKPSPNAPAGPAPVQP